MADVLLRFVHISDTHYSSPDYERPPSRFSPRYGVPKLIEQINALPYKPDFILHTGDVAYDPHPEIYEEIQSVFSAFTVPLHYVPGNHDHSATLQTTLIGREQATQQLYFEKEHNGVRMLFMDSNAANQEVVPPRGYVGPEQLDWLKARLAVDDDRPILVFIHHPLLKTYASEWFDEFMGTVNGEDVHTVLTSAASRIRGVFHGHIHHSLSLYRDGLLYSAVKSSWTQFNIHPGQEMATFNDLPADPGYHLVAVTTEGCLVQQITYRLD
jgi:Icc protein